MGLDGHTALGLAVLGERWDIIEGLVKAGADVNIARHLGTSVHMEPINKQSSSA